MELAHCHLQSLIGVPNPQSIGRQTPQLRRAPRKSVCDFPEEHMLEQIVGIDFTTVQTSLIDRSNREVQSADGSGNRERMASFIRGGNMFGIGDLFQWERFVTPIVIKVFYWLAVVISLLLGLAGAVSSLVTMAYNPFVGMIFLITSALGACMGVILSRIIAEFVLIVFRINEHLGAMRNRGQQL
jgi:Domain of unknown function (DUF4282)